MDEQKTAQGRLALVGLIILTVLTLLVFSFLFLDAGSLFSGEGNDPQIGSSSDSFTQEQTTDREQISSVIVEVQMKMNNFQTQLSSPYLLLVNESTPIPEDYTAELISLSGENSSKQLEKTAAVKMNEFLQAADKAGYNVTVTAAHRTKSAQEKVYNNAVQDFMNAGYPVETARSMAAMKVGSVNCSEHQLGLAVDFSAKEMSVLGADGRTFEQYLTDTMYKYGFVLSYPAGKESQTGHDANTAHYRYVGIEAARDMREKQWTLGEYRDYLQTQIDYLKQYIDSLEKK